VGEERKLRSECVILSPSLRSRVNSAKNLVLDRDARLAAPGMSKTYYVYIMASKSRTLYVGVTNNLERRVYEHKQRSTPGFTSKYNINRLVYYAETDDVTQAIAREKVIKGWVRSRKLALIEEVNPRWEDFSEGWYSFIGDGAGLLGEGRDSSLRSE
jgi:putative endonuclease